MPTITVSDDTYRLLAERAAAQGITVELLAAPVLERLAGKAGTNGQPPTADWQGKFEALNALILSRTNRYPPGFQADASRDAIYDGCGE